MVGRSPKSSSRRKIKLQTRPLSKNELPTPSDGWERSNQSCLAKMTKWSIYKLQSGFWDFPYKPLHLFRILWWYFFSNFKMPYLHEYCTDSKNSFYILKSWRLLSICNISITFSPSVGREGAKDIGKFFQKYRKMCLFFIFEKVIKIFENFLYKNDIFWKSDTIFQKFPI